MLGADRVGPDVSCTQQRRQGRNFDGRVSPLQLRETMQSLNPAAPSCCASCEVSGKRVKQSTQTQSIRPARVRAVAIDSYSDTRTAQRRSPVPAQRTRDGKA